MSKTYEIGSEAHDGTFEKLTSITFSNKAKAIQCAKRLAKDARDCGVSRWTVEHDDLTIASFRTKHDRLAHIR